MLLTSGDVVLRAIEYEDADFLRDMINDPQMEYMVVGWSLPVSRRRQLEWIESLQHHELKFIIEVNGTNVGMASITELDHKNALANLNIKIAQDFRGQGIGSRTINLLAKYCFWELNLNCLTATVLEYNTASRRLFEGCGFAEEGILRDRVYKRGRYHNVIVYSLLRSEFDA